MDRAEATGKNVNDAIENALLQLGKKRDDVDIEVLSEGSRGLLGIVGAEDARVVVTVKQSASRSAVAFQPAARRAAPPTPGQTRRFVGSLTPTVAQEEPEMAPIEAPDSPDLAVLENGVPVDESGIGQVVQGQEPPDQEMVDSTVEIVKELLRLLGLRAETEIRSLEYPLTINITGDDLGILIGRRGDTLGSLQFIVNLIVSRRLKRYVRIVVDVEDYRLRREHALRDLAAKAAERVRRSRQPVTLEAMPSNERRIVHLTLQGDRFVSTHSIGGGDDRRVVISPRPR